MVARKRVVICKLSDRDPHDRALRLLMGTYVPGGWPSAPGVLPHDPNGAIQLVVTEDLLRERAFVSLAEDRFEP